MHARLAHLQDEVRQANAFLSWWCGTRGLTLRLDGLSALGATSDFLDKWAKGQPVGAQPRAPMHAPNHPSLAASDSWAEAEWNRLERLGK
eukprot:3893417-Pyramimonas_sp.AAC.1